MTTEEKFADAESILGYPCGVLTCRYNVNGRTTCGDMTKNMTFNYNGEDTRYRLYAVRNDGKVIPQHVGCQVNLTWYQAWGRIEQIKQMKAAWIAKREFPVKKMKIVEISTKWKHIIEEEMTKSTTEEEIA